MEVGDVLIYVGEGYTLVRGYSYRIARITPKGLVQVREGGISYKPESFVKREGDHIKTGEVLYKTFLGGRRERGEEITYFIHNTHFYVLQKRYLGGYYRYRLKNVSYSFKEVVKLTKEEMEKKIKDML